MQSYRAPAELNAMAKFWQRIEFGWPGITSIYAEITNSKDKDYAAAHWRQPRLLEGISELREEGSAVLQKNLGPLITEGAKKSPGFTLFSPITCKNSQTSAYSL